LTANSQFTPRTIPELIAHAKANPGKINFASSGVGGGPHVSFELFRMMTSVDIVHVPYRANYIPDLLAGQIPLAFSSIAQVIPFIHDGRLRAIAVTPATRSTALPDVPTIAETLPGYAASGWYGLCAPRGTPDDVIAVLSAATAASVAEPDLRARFIDLGIEPQPMSTTEFGQFIREEIEKWAKVIRFAGLRPS